MLIPSPSPTSSSSSTSISPPLLNQTSKQQQFNQQQQQLASPPINIMRSNNICLNNPPLPVPMQPLHESDAMNNSPQHSSVPQMYSKHHGIKNRQKMKQSAPMNMNQQQHQNLRYRTLSCGSTGSFSASSSFSSSIGTSPVVNNQANTTNLWKKMLSNNPSSYVSTSGNYTGTSCSSNSTSSICTFRGDVDNSTGVTILNKHQEMFNDKLVASSGNMFHKRDDWSILTRIPVTKQNTIHIRLEDEGPYGNDEIRCYVLSHFSSLGVREVKCVLCNDELKLYDRFPLIDGTLFLSPIVYDRTKAINSGTNKREQFVYGVCVQCLSGENSIRCKWCKKEWNSESLQIGTLYKYDIFAAFPCCQKRISCNKCNKPVIDLNDGCGGLPFFSSYSEEIECQHCKFKSYHFIKPLDMIFNL